MDNKHIEAIKPLKSLNIEQLERCSKQARDDVATRVGVQPVRDNFTAAVSWRAVIQPLDFVGVLLFLVLLVISLIHMLTFTGNIANESFEATEYTGIGFTLLSWVLAHQLTFFAFSELGVLFFFIRHSMQLITWREQHLGEPMTWQRRLVSASSLAAFACAIIAIVANVTSLTYSPEPIKEITVGLILNAFIGFLIPVLTLLLGERAAEILIDFLSKKRKADEEFIAALTDWKSKTKYLDDYDERDGVNSFRQYLARRIVQYYRQHIVPSNKIEIEWTPELELALAARELARTQQMRQLESQVAFFTQPSPAEQSTAVAEEQSRSISTPLSLNGLRNTSANI